MANDLDLYDGGGDIQPYSEGMPVLAPLSPAPWRDSPDTLSNREIDEYQGQRSGPTLFGSPLPPGTTNQQINAVLGEIAGVFLSDFTKLGYPSSLIQAAISFFMDNATKAPRQVRRQHQFKLPKDQQGDWLAEAFANHLQGLSGTLQQRQQFLDAGLKWLVLANKKLNTKPVGSTPAQGRAPSTSELTDAEWEELNRRNEALKIATENTLRQRWGSAYSANMEVAQQFLNQLPANEVRHLSQITNQGVMLNTVQALTFLFESAIGANSIPKDSPGIVREIAECERCMRTNRKQWLADDARQARYRHLITLRDGG
ncbi:hypothetical protein ACIQUS_23160 [Pseudomonas sp. NPDC090755]|uniref:hypothetical protein n=1 Tax=Pseudomonas sp. NPDC090755 TaxID=3364481 RepID=UPI00383AD4A9